MTFNSFSRFLTTLSVTITGSYLVASSYGVVSAKKKEKDNDESVENEEKKKEIEKGVSQVIINDLSEPKRRSLSSVIKICSSKASQWRQVSLKTVASHY